MSARTLWIAAIVGLFFTATPRADVFLNEITIKGAERVELYNSGAGPVDVNGWTIQGSGSWVVAGAPLIPAEGYVVLDIPGDIFDDQGGFIELLDGLADEDRVSYGQLGSAPLPPGDFGFRGGPTSLARAPDGSTFTMPPPNSPATDGTIWTIDLSTTFGAVNDAPTAALGTTVVLNELDPKPLGGGDLVELYNPAAVPVDVTGWLLCNGDAFQTIAGSVPGGGFLTLTTDAGFELEANELVYLFRADEVRVDQIGFHLPPVARSAPTLDYCQCYARWTDGAGPNLGYDWFSSGGWVTLLGLVCTPGSSNQLVTSCQSTSAPDVQTDTWGRLKSHWR